VPGYDGAEISNTGRAIRGGRVELTFTRDPGGQTFLSRQFADYPYHLCRPHRFVGDPPGMATVYLQSVAGGIFESDRLHTRLVAEPDTEAHVTTQASTIVHGMEQDHATQMLSLKAGAGGFLEYLPDPTILFPAARLESRIHVRAHETATVLIADSFLVHDPDGRDATFDWLANDTVVAISDGRVIARDRFRVTGNLLRQRLPGLNGRYVAQGSMMVIHRSPSHQSLLSAVRGTLEQAADVYSGASLLPGGCGIWTRILAADGNALRRIMVNVWSSVRETLTGVTPTARRK
jgi:urease accessory protein